MKDTILFYDALVECCTETWMESRWIGI